MFLKIRHSLIARVICLSVIGVLLTTFIVIWAVIWTFEQSLDAQLDNHLTSYTDLLLSATSVKNGTVVLDKNNALLQSIPRHWQVDTPEKHIARSSILRDWLPLSPTTSFEPKRVLFKNHQADALVTVRQAFQLSGNKTIVITFGLEQAITEAYKAQLRNQFKNSTYKILLIVAVIIVILATIQVFMIVTPFKNIKLALQQVRQGEQDRIKAPLPLEVQLLSDEINHLLDYIEGIIKRHRTFSSNLAHALKTPLTVVRGESNSALIHEQIDVMLQVIDHNLSKSQTAATHNILSAKTPIEPLITRICNGYKKVYPKEFNINCPNSPIFYGDEADLFEVLGNLIENACKYGKSIVKITASNQSIIIEDDGPSIPQGEYDSVLKRGTQLDTTKDGAGLGLSITKEIVELYGGTLSLQQSTLGGLKAIVQLPPG